jgi:hypothetical protein
VPVQKQYKEDDAVAINGMKLPWRRGTMNIAYASGIEDSGSNPARVYISFF